ncbi:glycosyltransferase family 2 protein [Flavobacterium anhuiense]|uniref:Glycosyl transferase family 2 n=1 Tax=Flavobacterium anhuiense TaxID=459526 RepID=A0ABY0M073_9FLAO|nr:glycosyltransferase family 2 protein [Flavobacterium anhuiense]SCY84881.1 Glycosyl transferase family 2 [Flavobacterium anhuiense]
MIAILLSTYNGEKYLRDQLESLYCQTYSEFQLFVRDDGSTDSTISILEEYASKYSNIRVFKSETTNLGACESFMWLLKNVTAEYYMFCDQDDIWFPSKVQISLDALESESKRSNEKAIIVHTDLIVTDNNLDIIAKSLWENDNITPAKITRKYLKLVNYVTGCTMMFNRKARDLSIEYIGNILMHDFWISLCVDSSNGVIVSLPIPTIYYRQHTNNAIGASYKKHRFPILQRYFHIPDFSYSYDLYNVIRTKYDIGFAKYFILRITYYLKF